MSRTLEKVRRFIETHAMLDHARGVVVAVSGGADSVALLDMLVRLLPSNNSNDPLANARAGAINEASAKDFKASVIAPAPDARLTRKPLPGPVTFIHVAHLDHKLRGRESAEDAEFVRRLAERLGLSMTISESDVRVAAERAGRGIEEVAREIRYRFLLRVAREAGCDRIATGHTMNDQAETFLMRLVRGAGLRGLASMRPVGPAHDFSEQGLAEEEAAVTHEANNDLNVLKVVTPPLLPTASRPSLIRPLLRVTREEIEEYCHRRNLEFRTDTTNLKADYTRNRVRREVMPALRTINSRAVESIARAAEIISSDEDALDYLASTLLNDARLSRGFDYQVNEKTKTRELEATAYLEASAYSAAALLKQPVGLRRRMIIEAIRREQAARLNRRSAGAQITSTHVASVERLLGEQASGKRIILPSGLNVWREFDAIVFVATARGKEPIVKDEYKYEISGAHSEVEAGWLCITVERNQPSHLLEPLIKQARDEKQRLGRDWMIVALDESALPDRLIVRPRRAGERARVAGQSKTKKLKNLMIDHKIPSSRRSAWPVVTTPDDRYVWSPGLPPSLEFAARDKTTRLAILRVSNI